MHQLLGNEVKFLFSELFCMSFCPSVYLVFYAYLYLLPELAQEQIKLKDLEVTKCA